MKKTSTPRRRTTHAANGESSSAGLLAKHIGKSLLITLLAGAVLLVAFSLAAYFYADPGWLIRPLGLCALAVTALIGGIAAIRIHGKAALLCGILNGCALTAIMLLLSLCFRQHASGYSLGLTLLLHAGVLLLSVAGAFMGLKKPMKRRSKRR